MLHKYYFNNSSYYISLNVARQEVPPSESNYSESVLIDYKL